MTHYLSLAAAEDFEKTYELMEEAFPPIERRNREGQQALLSRSDYRLLVWKEQGEVCGFLAVWEFSDFAFVEHFAVSPELRGNGMGGTLLKEYLSGTEKQVVLEVELPETKLAGRRIRFYERIGMVLNHYPYEQPPLQEEMPYLPLMIMSYEKTLSQEEFWNVRDTLYREVYGV